MFENPKSPEPEVVDDTQELGAGAVAESENGKAVANIAATSKRKQIGRRPKRSSRGGSRVKVEKVDRPYPRVSLEDALKVPQAIKEKNGGRPWAPDQVAKALGGGGSAASSSFFYTAAGALKFGLTTGGRDAKEIGLTDLGRNIVFAGSPNEEERLKREAFLSVPVFKKVLEHYGGNNLPEMQYLSNTLEKDYGLHPSTHEEFSRLFKQNCDYLRIGARFGPDQGQPRVADHQLTGSSQDVITVAEAEQATGLVCFVAMPFQEKTERYPAGYFQEVLTSLVAPAGRQAGFTVTTAKRQGTDVIQSTIINDLLAADLVLVDLTEHNPNVLFELGVRIAKDKPVVLIRATGTTRIFDVDNMLRVFDYSPNLWHSTVEQDAPRLADHIRATWENRESSKTYMQILLSHAADRT